ncbi:unnamed protein product [Acanthoscelides obtectus]|uniref:Uncharacterized protein n=1 Tax=Acanthoscelides obtectus TaxID=200917 RepID=A0A9P0PQ50_ACAOB|nr:unnamed protein product [Acanthoscelides obtectus]CAK1638301.1 hypothetical protein AOBTE_LOCUS10516 [Acanthoscelides obtectus]
MTLRKRSRSNPRLKAEEESYNFYLKHLLLKCIPGELSLYSIGFDLEGSVKVKYERNESLLLATKYTNYYAYMQKMVDGNIM